MAGRTTSSKTGCLLNFPSPSTGFKNRQLNTGEFPSGQRGQTVNLLRIASMVRIRPPPPQKTTILRIVVFCGIGIWEGGFERRLLASARWALATAVAFPQKSESVSPLKKPIPTDWSFLRYQHSEDGFERAVQANMPSAYLPARGRPQAANPYAHATLGLP